MLVLDTVPVPPLVPATLVTVSVAVVAAAAVCDSIIFAVYGPDTVYADPGTVKSHGVHGVAVHTGFVVLHCAVCLSCGLPPVGA